MTRLQGYIHGNVEGVRRLAELRQVVAMYLQHIPNGSWQERRRAKRYSKTGTSQFVAIAETAIGAEEMYKEGIWPGHYIPASSIAEPAQHHSIMPRARRQRLPQRAFS